MRLSTSPPGKPLPQQSGDLAEQYQTSTRNLGFTKRYAKAHETHYAPWVQQLVADAPLHLDELPRVRLPAPDLGLLSAPLGEAIARRRSGRSYAGQPITAAHLSTILYAANGVRPAALARGPHPSRNVTNAGNLGSVEMYPVVMDVAGVEPGMYHFDCVDHDLALVARGHFGTWLSEVVLFQIEFGEAAVGVILTSAVGRLKAKYGPRGYRFALLDIGHVSQNIYLSATALSL
ncbi:MAG TPA: SagB/ThcOx family dehydrogenase, partial [Microlunatus sp.]|nr:SagB/ThcOx family dehydrogenase [Microlunatus sp.]